MHPELKAHPDYFQQEIVQLADNVYQAYGFAASNVYMIVGNDGLIIIDTSESIGAAENILAEFRKISDLPIKTIIFTHSHRDHVSGASVFVEGASPEILASDKYSEDSLFVASSHARPVKAMQARTKRQFGFTLSYPDERISIGIGPGERPLKGMGAGSVPPTRMIGEEGEQISPCGIILHLSMAPGETPDHMVVWYPEKKILFSGDNFYRSFPNLYAIRGTAYREFDTWADSLDQLMAFDPEILAPGHTKALVGADQIQEILGDYRDGIRHIIAETIAGIDAGLTPDELAHTVKLPAHLAEKSYLKEYYGHVGHAVRAYFTGNFGWFDGNPSSLEPLHPAIEAEKVIALAGGSASVLAAAQSALEADEPQWALELADRLIAAKSDFGPASTVKIAALRMLADKTINAPTRNYLLLYANEMESEA